MAPTPLIFNRIFKAGPALTSGGAYSWSLTWRAALGRVPRTGKRYQIDLGDISGYSPPASGYNGVLVVHVEAGGASGPKVPGAIQGRAGFPAAPRNYPYDAGELGPIAFQALLDDASALGPAPYSLDVSVTLYTTDAGYDPDTAANPIEPPTGLDFDDTPTLMMPSRVGIG